MASARCGDTIFAQKHQLTLAEPLRDCKMAVKASRSVSGADVTFATKVRALLGCPPNSRWAQAQQSEILANFLAEGARLAATHDGSSFASMHAPTPKGPMGRFAKTSPANPYSMTMGETIESHSFSDRRNLLVERRPVWRVKNAPNALRFLLNCCPSFFGSLNW